MLKAHNPWTENKPGMVAEHGPGTEHLPSYERAGRKSNTFPPSIPCPPCPQGCSGACLDPTPSALSRFIFGPRTLTRAPFCLSSVQQGCSEQPVERASPPARCAAPAGRQQALL